jgi:hypothetical protein
MRENLVEALDRPAKAPRCSPWRVLVLLGAGTFTAALFASAPLLVWAQRLPPGPATETLLAGCEAWDGAMQALGTAQWHGRLRAVLQSAKERRFGAAEE